MEQKRKGLERLVHLDRRIMFSFIFLATLFPILFPINLSVSVTPPVQSFFDKIESLGPGDVIIVSFDYGPTTAPENTPMADAVLRHCLRHDIKVLVIAFFPIGGSLLAEESTARMQEEFPDKTYGVDLVNLGYKAGAQAAMKQMGTSIRRVFPVDAYSTPLDSLPMMRNVDSYADVALVASFATGIIGEWWANLINAQFGIPVAVGCTAVSAPKYYAYLESGQMIGLLGGLKGASEYEHLLLTAYPEFNELYGLRTTYTAVKGMVAQTVDHIIIMLFIIFGNVVFFLTRKQKTGR